MDSIWNGIKARDKRLALDKNIKRHIVVVGGGISGILAAFRLCQNQSVTLVESNTLFSSTTHNTTAHIDAMHGYLYSDLIKTSPNKAKLYFQSQTEAIDEFENIIHTYKIDCDFQRVNSYMFTTQNPQKLKEEYLAIKKIGGSVEFLQGKVLNIETKGVINLKKQAQFHPIKFLSNLPKNFEIIENTRVLKVDTKNKILYAKNAEIQADIIIIATGFPIIDIPGFYFAKMYKSSSYNIAFKGKLEGMYQADLENGLTYRNFDDYIIMGGLDHRTGRLDFKNKYERLKEKAKLSFGEGLEFTHNWTANDCITADGIPFVGRYSKLRKDIYVMTGYNKWGMTNSMVASKIIFDLVNAKENPYIDLFSPYRKKTNYTHCFINTMSVIKNLLFKPVAFPQKNADQLNLGEGDIVLYNGKKKAVYKDLAGKLYVLEPLCPHLKCQLKFNAQTKTWDCPCHGSRFDIHGNIIASPTVKELDNAEHKE